MKWIVKDKIAWVMFFLVWWAREVPRSEGRWEKDGKRGETSTVRLCLILVSVLWLASLERSH